MCLSLILGLHLATYHFDRTHDFNEANFGGYVECEQVVGGAYYNSYRRVSPYLAYRWSFGPVDVVTGAVGGYEHPIMPLVVPSIRLWDHWRVSLLPPVKQSEKGGVHLSWEIEL